MAESNPMTAFPTRSPSAQRLDRGALAERLTTAQHLARRYARTGWFYGLYGLMDRQTRVRGVSRDYRPERPVPTTRALFAKIDQLYRADAAGVAGGIMPTLEASAAQFATHVGRVRAMFRDLPVTLARRKDEARQEVAEAFGEAGLPAYYLQNFHYQTGGYLTEDSAELYDVQVETLFMGSAHAMRRVAFRPIAEFMAGRDQRKVQLLDVACGTGRLLRDIRRHYPAMALTGLDLSQSYLAEAERHLDGLRAVTWLHANAETLPLPDASQDIVTSVFLFHELPAPIRRIVATEWARVLKPGGLLVFIDSLQYGDEPGFDGLLEAFPVRFHEPYYRNYLEDNLAGLFEGAGLRFQSESNAFLSKMIVCHKPE